MIALVCEKSKIDTQNGDVYYSLTLASYNSHFKEYRILYRKDKNGTYVPRHYFVKKDLFDSVKFAVVYDFGFEADDNGNATIVSAVSSKF